eukprot:CAMPEP_0172461868 /NCGR_PEP_ID=MMETSP1065-20121228/41979_1 /TAXON_ID=265537 /ORGANISM="Amphiprora paludosa, Strain CCMP125" /LENGTH=53 /DNA_ID=CAMNT_0013217343 /DNA_START=90 /DNA_END=251 /DNA_ORIENTATION=-
MARQSVLMSRAARTPTPNPFNVGARGIFRRKKDEEYSSGDASFCAAAKENGIA